MRPEHLAQLPTLKDCVHCGLCLRVCPTYHVTGREVQSPRGRIAALRAMAEERVAATAALHGGLEDCLVCRACESACPSGISMEALMSGYRAHVRPESSDLLTRLEGWFLAEILPDPRRLETLTSLLRGVAPVARALGLPVEFPGPHRLRPPTPLARLPESPAASTPRPSAPQRGTVVLFRGCIADHWFREETRAAQRVLTRNGWQVEIPEPTCCGALAHHAGLEKRAAGHECSTAAAVSSFAGAAYLVVDAAACATSLAEHGALEVPVIDTLGLLEREGWDPPTKRLPGDWVVAPPCHQTHGALDDLGTRAVLDTILEQGYRELPPPELCCGAAGLYIARRPRLSQQIGELALSRFEESGARGLITGNPGCLLRWEHLLGRNHEVLHPVVAVARAYELDDAQNA